MKDLEKFLIDTKKVSDDSIYLWFTRVKESQFESNSELEILRNYLTIKSQYKDISNSSYDTIYRKAMAHYDEMANRIKNIKNKKLENNNTILIFDNNWVLKTIVTENEFKKNL